METCDVRIPGKDEFDLSSYIPYYSGLLIALDKEGNAIGYIDYSYEGDNYSDGYSINFKESNCGANYIFTTFKELFDCMNKNNKEIYSLKLIKFE